VRVAKLMRRKSVAAIRSAGRTAGLTKASMIFSIVLCPIFFSQGSKAGHFTKSFIFLGMLTRSILFDTFFCYGLFDSSHTGLLEPRGTSTVRFYWLTQQVLVWRLRRSYFLYCIIGHNESIFVRLRVQPTSCRSD